MWAKQQSRISKPMALVLCTIYEEFVWSQPRPRVTSSRTQELLGNAAPQDGEETKHKQGVLSLVLLIPPGPQWTPCTTAGHTCSGHLWEQTGKGMVGLKEIHIPYIGWVLRAEPAHVTAKHIHASRFSLQGFLDHTVKCSEIMQEIFRLHKEMFVYGNYLCNAKQYNILQM